MTKVMLLTEDGYLPAGIHDMDLQEFESAFVSEFSNSTTRAKIFEGYKTLCDYFFSNGLNNFDVWLDGSFVTSKENPNDIDLVLFVSYNELNSLNAEQQNNIMQAVSSNGHDMIHDKFYCDIYTILVPPVDNPEYQKFTDSRMYWRGVWGFDRQDKPKGWIKITYGKGVENEQSE